MSSEPNIGDSTSNGLGKVLSSSPEPVETPSSTIHDNALRHSRTVSSSSSSSSSSRLTERPPPFSRKLTRALFIRPAETRVGFNVLFVFNPIAWALHYTHQTDVPLAGMLGHGTETIALYTGDALGGLINASLGNATEFIIAILLLVKCEIRVVQASLLGGLLSNLLLVTGMAFIVGGAQLNTSLLTLAVIALVIPTCFAFAIEQASGEETERDVILEMSRGSALILIFIYVSYMVFQLYSHSYLYNPDNDVLNDVHSSASSVQSAPAASAQPTTPIVNDELSRPPVNRTHSLTPSFGSRSFLGHGMKLLGRRSHSQLSKVDEKEAEIRRRAQRGHRDLEAAGVAKGDTDSEKELETPEMNLTVAISVLIAATGLTYLTAEALTDSLEGIGQSGSVSTEWLGLILLAIVGNAAEHVTAVFVAYRNKIDLALAVSVGSCIQISLFVIPLLVLIGWIANKPLSLLFDPLEVVTLFLSVLLVRFATEDGRTHYMSGILLFGTYVLIVSAILESFLTMPPTPTSSGILVLVLPSEWY
ncbi:Sodium/calcium exchanger protein-domain-containing protein [Desarmillaria tabescens]|uniref:Sodium/calcium exchanger protein-domain-containing protein n=1 Tax=Armillaria tabescens TaxID=1929756 RepID=A0AA39T644_ARMTA|nr:Sodium/calcium exchanger protein-domain-containing protein [Desarmillaria tabescens]KAK0467051.1 Sodium/calcium exchanger protein-domain-containing protein [Desarmillaria tabescens]